MMPKRQGAGRSVSYSIVLCAIAQIVSGAATRAWSYGTLFTPRLQVPGAGSVIYLSNLHNGIHGLEWENGLGFGLNPALGVNASASVFLENPERENRIVDVGHADVELVWRAFNFDSFASKRAIVVNAGNRFTPSHDSDAGYSMNNFLSGSVGLLVDHINWITISDFRIDRSSETDRSHDVDVNDPVPAHTAWIDGAFGWRFYKAPASSSDAMWVLDSNVRLNHGRAWYAGSELIYQPRERMLFKAGYRYPVFREGDVQPNSISGGSWAYEMQFRF